MVEIGCLARYFNLYSDEVQFARENGFDFMQLWYDDGGLRLHELDQNPIEIINRHGFPTIIHAVLDIHEIDAHIPKLLALMNDLQHRELILHPVSEKREISAKTLDMLDAQISAALDVFSSQGITLFVENNSRRDPIFNTSDEIDSIFSGHKELELVLDVAHASDFSHLKALVAAKMPKMLHVSDRRKSVVHEHLPLGNGDIDFELIFDTVLSGFGGRMILEVVEEDADIVRSKRIMERIIGKTAGA